MDASTEEIFSAIDKVISANQFSVPHPKQNEWVKVSKSHLEGLRMKSLAILHKNASYCSINDDGENLIFYPTRNGGQSESYGFIPDKKISISKNASSELIVTALKEALRISSFEEGNVLN